jgi:ADP-heptose:LPS heptosyltransferase
MAKVLVIRISSLGDVAMLVPVICSVAAKYPQDRFSVMTRKAFAPLFENLGFNINVLPLDIKGRHRGILGFFRTIRRISTLGFSHVADEDNTSRSRGIRYFMWMTGRKVVAIDKGHKEKRKAVEEKTLEQPLTHTIQRYRDVFDKLGFPAQMVFNNIFDFIPRDFSKLKTIAQSKEGNWIGIAPFSRDKGKIYPLEKMEKIVEALSGQSYITIFLFGIGKEEEKVLSLWAGKYPNVVNTVGKLNLERELLLMSYLDVMLSMDSPNMHLTSLVQIPVISIWGATHPFLGSYGFGQDAGNAIHIDMECRPCSVAGDLPCRRNDYACLEQIPEDMVVEQIHKVLNRKQT